VNCMKLHRYSNTKGKKRECRYTLVKSLKFMEFLRGRSKYPGGSRKCFIHIQSAENSFIGRNKCGRGAGYSCGERGCPCLIRGAMRNGVWEPPFRFRYVLPHKGTAQVPLYLSSRMFAQNICWMRKPRTLALSLRIRSRVVLLNEVWGPVDYTAE